MHFSTYSATPSFVDSCQPPLTSLRCLRGTFTGIQQKSAEGGDNFRRKMGSICVKHFCQAWLLLQCHSPLKVCMQDPETCTSANQPRCPSSLPWKNRFTGVFPANPFMRTPKREAIPKPYTTESQGDTNSEKLVGCLRHFHILFLRIERAFMLALLCHAP